MPENKKLNLAAYGKKPENKPVLAEKRVTSEINEAVITTPKKSATKKKTKGGVGRPSKPAKERRVHKITINLTDAERESVKEKAGMVPEATFLINALREHGVFEK